MAVAKMEKCKVGPDGLLKRSCPGMQILEQNKCVGAFDCGNKRGLAVKTASQDQKDWMHVNLNFCPSCGGSLQAPAKKRTRKKTTLPPVGTQLPMSFTRKAR
jgi:hypothetical protein